MRLAILSCLALSACAFALPPSRVEVGRTARPDHNGTQIAVGGSVGSMLPATKSRFELGLGIISRSSEEASTETSKRGVYVDIGYAVLNSEHARMLVGFRGEHFGGAGEIQAAKLRVDAEVLANIASGGAGGGGCGGGFGGVVGNFGLGVFAEAGRVFGNHMLDPDGIGWTASAGITVRLPFMGGVAFSSNSAGCSGGDSGSSWFPSGKSRDSGGSRGWSGSSGSGSRSR